MAQRGARLAVAVVEKFEKGAEHQVVYGDPESERIGEVISVAWPGVQDIGQEQIFAYGMRARLPRMLYAMQARGSRATFFKYGGRGERPVAGVCRRGAAMSLPC